MIAPNGAARIVLTEGEFNIKEGYCGNGAQIFFLKN